MRDFYTMNAVKTEKIKRVILIGMGYCAIFTPLECFGFETDCLHLRKFTSDLKTAAPLAPPRPQTVPSRPVPRREPDRPSRREIPVPIPRPDERPTSVPDRPLFDPKDELNLKTAPVAPPAPVKPARPLPAKPVEPERRPSRREVPIPRPDEKPHFVPDRPLFDPKDLNPEDLYSGDAHLKGLWNDLPLGMKRVMVEGLREEKAQLTRHLEEKYGTHDPNQVQSIMLNLMRDIETIESQHRPKILGVIRDMIQERYGDAVTGLKIGITADSPSRVSPTATGESKIPGLPHSFNDPMIYRTEVRNLWQQGEGWIGMKEFSYGKGKELDAISPGLSEKYQELDRLNRWGQIFVLAQIPDSQFVSSLPQDAFSAGRDIVTTQFELVDRPDGKVDRVKKGGLTGVATGRNGWAAAHEARKAAAQMATPAEGALRWMMSPEQKKSLDEATNSQIAELRQGVYGPAVVVALRKRLATLHSGGQTNSMSDEDYHFAADGVFSLPPDAFKYGMTLLFDSSFEKDAAKQEEAKQFLKQYGVFP